jgi:hypothetical protein
MFDRRNGIKNKKEKKIGNNIKQKMNAIWSLLDDFKTKQL